MGGGSDYPAFSFIQIMGSLFLLDLYYNNSKIYRKKKIENPPTKVYSLSVQKTMIILRHTKINFKKNIQNQYNYTVSHLNFSDITCSCNHHDWAFHCRYKRYVDFFGVKFKIKIQRIRCLHCGKTHAILFEDIIPFSCVNQKEVISFLHGFVDADQRSLSFFLKSKFTLELLHDYCSLCLFAARNLPVLFISLNF